jgi:arsenate reductase (glutaredoxin)
MIQVYFNPYCSKCITTGCLLEQRKIEFERIEYLNTPPTQTELISIIQKLGIQAHELMRKNEPVYIEKYGTRQLSEEESIHAMLLDPILIERPIVVDGDRAIICRPPEKLYEFLLPRK